jgi:hypothetical protein
MSLDPSQACSREFPGTVAAAADAEFAINLCLEELFLNAVQHGRANRATISIWAAPGGARVEFVADGAPFDPTGAPAARSRNFRRAACPSGFSRPSRSSRAVRRCAPPAGGSNRPW